MYSIYKLTDPNGLVYIGCTQQSVKARLHGTYNKKLMAAFKKYGIDSFDIDVLATTDSAAEAKQLECENIQLYESYNSNKGYNATSFSGYTSTTKNIKDKVFTMRCSDYEQQFLTVALKWYRAQSMLVEIGTIKQIPEIFKCGYQQQVSPSGIVSGGIAELPPFVEDVLNGGTYPNPEDCTEEERAVLYDAKFKMLFKTYIQAKDDRVRMNLRQSMLATVNEILG